MRTNDRTPRHRLTDGRPASVLLAVMSAGLATALRYALDPLLGDTSQYITFYVAVMLVAAVGGLLPGLLATGLGVLLSMWLFVEPRGVMAVGGSSDLVRLVAFLMVGIGVTLIAERVHVHRRRAEARTAELHEMLELVDLGHLLMRGMDDRIIRWTAGCERLYGYTAAEAVGRVGVDLLHTEFPVPVERIHRQLHERGRWEGELVHRHKDGRRVTVASLWLLHRDRGGKPATILESNSNISGLRRTEERLRLVLEAARIGTWEWDLRSGALEWSRHCKELFGLPPHASMSFERFLEAVHPEDRQRVEASWRAALEQQTECDVELRSVWPDGSVHWIASHGRAYYDGSGRAHRMAGAAMDITERKGMEEKVRSIAQFPEENVSPVLRLGDQGQVLYANPAAARLLEDLLGSAEGRCPPVMQPPMEEALRTGSVQELEVICRRGRTFSFSCVPVRERHYVNLYGRDVTEARRIEAELEAARQAAEEASKAKDHFLAVLSHELRTPLTPVLTAVSMLQDDPRWDEGVQQTLEMVRRNVELEARLIDDLLDVTRIARGKIELEKKPVPLSEVIRRAVEVCKPDIEGRRLHFGVDIGPAAPYLVYADTARLQQVFWNLLKNAIKFTPHGGCVGVRCRLDDHTVTVEVNDNGVGIDPGELARIFTAFEHERATTRPFGGLGLGLAIARAIVEMHGGAIEAHSDGRHKGATFRVRLPILEPTAAERGRPATVAATLSPRRPLRILLVEDHGDTAEMMRVLLTMHGHSVTVAGDVATALEEAGKGSFDLLLSDLGLPDGTGTDLMRALRARGDTMPGIAVTGYGQEQDIQRSRGAGFAAHLTKPASPERLAEVMAAVIGEPSTPPHGGGQ